MLDSFDLAAFASGATLPSSEANTIACDIDETLRSVGFLLVTGHGVPDDVRESYFDAMRAFFALPIEEKERIAIGNGDCHRGYVGFATEALEGALAGDEAQGGQVAGDLKETLDTGLEHGADHPDVLVGTPLHGPNQWPDLPGFRETVETYRDAMIEAALRMERALSTALGLDPYFLESQPGETMFHLRLIHYPPMETLTPEAGQLGCGVHTDYGSLTLLADDGNGGLQVRQRAGGWTDIAIPDGQLVVNLGDLMAIWTDDRWVSNPHRVVNPPGVDRYSSPLFVTPPFHLTIETLPTCLAPGESPRHEPMVTGPYLLSRFDGTHSYRNELLDDD